MNMLLTLREQADKFFNEARNKVRKSMERGKSSQKSMPYIKVCVI